MSELATAAQWALDKMHYLEQRNAVLTAAIGYAYSELKSGPAAELCDLYAVATTENRDALCRVRERLRQALAGK